jgi:hypothetical protein
MYEQFRDNNYFNEPETMLTPPYIIGVDLGKANDYTAVSVLSSTGGKIEYPNPSPNSDAIFLNPSLDVGRPIISKPHYQLVHLERMRGKPYPDIVSGLKQMVLSFGNNLRTRPPLVVDATGVGAAVIDMLKAEELKPIAITITGGDKANGGPLEYRVPKRDLASTLSVLFQGHRITIGRNLPEFMHLVDELSNFKVKISDTGHDTYSAWRESDHDDMVLSVAVAAWYAEKLFRDKIPVEEDSNIRASDYVLLGGGGSN